MTLEREVESDRLVLDRAERGGAEGWAYRAPKRPFGRLAGTSLKITVDGAVLTRWPCDVPRADVDEAMGDAERAKGFRVPLDPLMVLMTLTTSARRPRVRLAFGSRRIALEKAVPTSVMTAFPELIADAWLADSGHLRLRTGGALRAVRLAQFTDRLVHRDVRVPARPAVVTLSLADPMAPVVLVLRTETSIHLDAIPFPSLLRGGLHAAEALACAPSGDAVPRLASRLAQCLARKTCRRRIVLAPADAHGALAARPPVRRFLEAHADLVNAERSQEGEGPGLEPDAIPSIAILCGPAEGFVAHDPSPGGATMLVRPVLDPRFDDAVLARDGDGDGDADGDRCGGLGLPSPSAGADETLADAASASALPPATIRIRAVPDVGLDPYLFPLTPEADLPFPKPFVVAIAATSSDDELLLEGLPETAGVVRLAEPQLGLSELGREGGTVLFCDPKMVAHDRRVFGALQRLALVPGVASAGCSVIVEPGPYDRVTQDRVRLGGLFATHAAVDSPWRAPYGPLVAPGILERTTYRVVANHPSFVMISTSVLREFGADLRAAEPAALMALMLRASAAGRIHAATTWVSVFDRGAPEPALPIAVNAPTDGMAVTTLVRLA